MAQTGVTAPARPVRVPALDGLRGFAALVVFLTHMTTAHFPTGGLLGVEMFFVLSGFLITGLLLDEAGRTGTVDFAAFFVRRAMRLLPPFLVMIGIYLAIRYAFAPEQPGIGPRRLLLVLLASNIQPVTYLGHVWSLSLEWQFYLAWPFVLLALLKGGAGPRTVGWLALAAAAALWAARPWYFPGPRCDGLLLGVALACLARGWAVRAVPSRAEQALGAASMAVLLCLVLALNQPGIQVPPWLPFDAAPAATMVLIGCAIRSPRSVANRVLGNPVLVWFGGISYGLYCYHFPIAAALYFNHMPPGPMLAVGLVAIPIAFMSREMVEAPLLRWAHRRRTGRRPLPASISVRKPDLVS